jgi:hypothetical protein
MAYQAQTRFSHAPPEGVNITRVPLGRRLVKKCDYGASPTALRALLAASRRARQICV